MATKVRGRIYWRKAEVAKIDMALDGYGGRGAYERFQSQMRHRAAMRRAQLPTHKRGASRRGRVKALAASHAQRDLFGD